MARESLAGLPSAASGASWLAACLPLVDARHAPKANSPSRSTLGATDIQTKVNNT